MRISDWSSDVCSSDLFFFRHTQPIQVKKTAKKESSTITRKIACTTAAVVRKPTSSAFPSTCMPWKQPETAMIIPNTGALINPTYRSVLGTTYRHGRMNVIDGIYSQTPQRKRTEERREGKGGER